MTVQNNPSTGPVQPNSARSDDADQAQEAAQADGAEGAESAAPDETTSGDRVEISDTAQAAQAEVGSDAALIESGRQELTSSSLSAERLSELREQVENGRYTEPDVTQQVAEGLAEDLGRAASGGA
jgi:anti-sigma28 factor (negative regulator of flagellin synthesis)